MPDIFVSSSDSSKRKEASSLKKDLKNESPQKTKKIDQALSAYLFMPDGMSFETQEPGETIILLLRKHWVTNFLWIFLCAIFILIPVFLFPGFFYTELIPSSVTDSYISFFIFVWYLFVFSYALVNFLLWYFTVSIVTNERIIDIDFVNILHKKFAATRISRIEDVTMRRGGIVKAIFDYGDVIVQTAAREAEFQFYQVPHPEKVVRIVNSLMGKEEEDH